MPTRTPPEQSSGQPSEPPPETRPLVVFVVGPTATGKSDFAIEAALRFGGEIINIDSVQIYSGVEIGAAKPTLEERRGVAHHLLGEIPEGGTCTAGDFRRRALDVIARGGGGLFFAVGGSGFYAQALEKGMYPVPEVPAAVRASVQADFDAVGREALHAELRERDPGSAAEISPNDTYRLFRALEVVRSLQGAELPQGRPEEALTWSGLRRRFEGEAARARPFRVLKIGLYRDRQVLRAAVARRARRMLERGLVEEVSALRAKGLGGWAPLLSVGYKETQDVLDGRLAGDRLAEEIATHTMQLAKRQMTWFRRDPGIQWFDADRGWGEPLAWLDSRLPREKNESL